MAPNSPELSLLKFLPLTYHHSHFLAATMDFTSFFTIAFLRAALFLQLGCFALDFTSFCICIPQSRPMAGFGAFLTYLFSLSQEEEKMKQMLNTLNISNFIIKCTNYISISYIYLLQNSTRGLILFVNPSVTHSCNPTLYKVTYNTYTYSVFIAELSTRGLISFL